MHDEKQGTRFWIGNAILALALLVLLFMGSLWEQMGILAMVVWTALAAVGIFLIMTDKSDGPKGPN